MNLSPASDAALPPEDLALLRNHSFDELDVGDSASLERTLSTQDLRLFAALSGAAVADGAGASAGAGAGTVAGADDDDTALIAHGMWGGMLLASVLGTRLPGPGTTLVGQTLRFLAPLAAGDRLTVRVEVLSKQAEQRQVTLAVACTNQHGAAVIEGQATVHAPARHIERQRTSLPEIRLEAGGRDGLQRLLAHVAGLPPIRVAVVHPCDETSLSAAMDARREGLIDPVLVAPRARLEAVAAEHGLDLGGLRIEDVPHSHAAATRGAELAACGEVEAIMKGSLHTDELMAEVVAAAAGLRTKRRVSHCFVLQTPHYPRPFIVTDAAINLAPDLQQKADIVRNAIALAHAIGVPEPKVAILAAVETVSPHMPATLDAAALCKMADRGQISGAILDGPLAYDNAISLRSAHHKGIVSDVAGQPDVLLVPSLEAGNMIYKQLVYMADAECAGLVLGMRVPIVLTSRSDSVASRIASCALAVLASAAGGKEQS